jgi:hypothetical protein
MHARAARLSDPKFFSMFHLDGDVTNDNENSNINSERYMLLVQGARRENYIKRGSGSQ